jgi:HlyD family secretion protein
MKYTNLLGVGLIILAASCSHKKIATDASGVFESDEVIVSAEQSGKLLSFPIQEGDTLTKGANVGDIDINSAIDQLQKQIAVSKQQIALDKSNIATQNRTVYSEQVPLEKSAAQIQNNIDKGKIINPIKGTVLTKYALEGEMTTTGKALYKIANLDTLTLRAYVTGSQLTQVKLGQSVKVYSDEGADQYREYAGRVYWISDKSEFTPKTIQTRDERANLVYAVKIHVKNDGYLKLGMYGEVKF